ncbi:riboflavin synthase [Butyrivibrio sp. YAB3001]|uniref:riboflavin synthase n=1 Tax=Butyrivibrio sp. YAB3001 TaxID=1520812 RepID=UPI0008F67303|nr:riboflavin synthase [Butyrivibrio sp. YAB3001]SFD08885.1 riboflavin synthase alpha chain [Butyrivibrio sp. YAB3001]
MFTGIIEEIGKIKSVNRGSANSQMVIGADKVLSDVQLGDSIAVNGVCLTVVSFNEKSFTVDVMNETYSRSSLGDLRVGSLVNLERAMPSNGRFGGHIVSGHIDGTGRIKATRCDGNAVWYEITADSNILNGIVEKGSIAIDGISLTVALVTTSSFSVSIIPHTLERTILKEKRAGSVVNLENDIIGKYVYSFLSKSEGKKDFWEVMYG